MLCYETSPFFKILKATQMVLLKAVLVVLLRNMQTYIKAILRKTIHEVRRKLHMCNLSGQNISI